MRGEVLLGEDLMGFEVARQTAGICEYLNSVINNVRKRP